MLQRKQTLFLLLALVCTSACLCLPVGVVRPIGMGSELLVFNLWMQTADGSPDFGVWPLFAILIASVPLCIAAVAMYKRRPLQMALCTACMLTNMAWGVYYAVVFSAGRADGLSPTLYAALPMVSIILYFMARQGIVHDEKLVRSADRLR